jgi:nucleotide-binding universal stress UspA family protein
MPTTQLLALTDGSAACRGALRVALALARDSHARLTVLHVIEREGEGAGASRSYFKRVVPESGPELARRVESAERRVRNQLHAVVSRARHVEVRIVVEVGRFLDTVLEQALAVDAALVVFGKGRKTSALAPKALALATALSRPSLMVPAKWTRAPGARGALRGTRPRATRRLPEARATRAGR